jgi:hypothetical protein
MAIQFTPDGFRAVVAMSLTGEAGEHTTDVRDGSLLALARSVADRCVQLCEERGQAMSDDVYDEAVRELAPHFADPPDAG